MTSDQIELARSWLMDCVWVDQDAESMQCLPDAKIVKAISRHYEGGIAEFLQTVV